MKTRIIAIALLLTSTSNLYGDLVFSHSGNTDPTTEGWTLDLNGSGTSVGPITDDLGTGIDSWFADDDGTIGTNGAHYDATPTALQVANGNAFGWTLSTRLRVVDTPDEPDPSVVALYRDGTTSWQMHFGAQADGDTIVELATISGGPTYTLDGSGGGYHLFELKYDPVALSADLFVDGTEKISNYTGFSFGTTLVSWGAGSSADTGQGNFADVNFSTAGIPEPSSFALLGIGAVGIGVLRRRNKRVAAA